MRREENARPVTRWRYRLWFGLAALWNLFFIQALFPPAYSRRGFVSVAAIVTTAFCSGSF
jgi:hypothetical protein